MQPRLLVATVTAVCLVALAGCSQPAGSLSMDPVNDTELADHASTTVPEDELAAEHERGPQPQVLSRAVQNESATVAATDPPHKNNSTVYRTGDRFYTLSYTTVGTTSGREVTYRFDGNATTDEADRNGWATVAYDDLPPVDRAMLRTPLSVITAEEGSRSSIKERRTYSPSELNQSVIADQRYDAIRYDGTLVEVDVTSSEPRPLTVYRYQPRLVATTADAYAACLRDEYVFELSGLDPNTRETVNEAADGTYRAENTSDTAFRSLLETFHSHTAVSANTASGSWITRYEGRLYWVDLRYTGFESYRDSRPRVRAPAAVCS